MQRLINGSHYDENDSGYYEWWYFHFVSESGFEASVVLHETDIFGLVKNPYISISCMLPDGEKNTKKQYQMLIKFVKKKTILIYFLILQMVFLLRHKSKNSILL